jgi:uncharacterized MnhB-related membrane protein
LVFFGAQVEKKEISLQFRETAVPSAEVPHRPRIGNQETLRRLFELKKCVKRPGYPNFARQPPFVEKRAFFLTGACGGRMMGPFPGLINVVRHWREPFSTLRSDARKLPCKEGFCMIIQTLVLSATLLCALQAIRAPRLLVSALWLAGCSALLALSIGLLWAPEVGVVELSVGAGLVTIIFVFAINVAGEETIGLTSIVPRPVAWGLMGLFLFLLAWLSLPGLVGPALPRDALPFLRALWDERSLDTVLQVALIFSGVLGSIGLLAERKEAGHESGAAGGQGAAG